VATLRRYSTRATDSLSTRPLVMLSVALHSTHKAQSLLVFYALDLISDHLHTLTPGNTCHSSAVESGTDSSSYAALPLTSIAPKELRDSSTP